MKRNLVKIITVLVVLLIVLSNLVTFAVNLSEKFNGNLSNDLSGAKTATQEIVGTVLDVVRIVGMGIALIMLTYIGIKFMLASPNERANIKQYSINYVIGAFILIAGVGLLTVVRDFALTIKAGT